MRVYYDTEFLENGSTIRLISIGMIREDGKRLYRVVKDYPLIVAASNHPWLRANVLTNLPVTYDFFTGKPLWDDHHKDSDYRTLTDKETVADDVTEFLLDTPDLELWAYYAAYDHVALCQLFGTMMDLPEGIPMYTNDIKQEYFRRYGSQHVTLVQTSGEHNALEDAKHNWRMAFNIGITDVLPPEVYNSEISS